MPRRRKYTSGNELIPTKYGMQSTSTKLILYNWMHPTKNRLKDPEMTANELPKSKLPCRKPLTKNHSTKVVRDPKHFHGEVNEHQPDNMKKSCFYERYNSHRQECEQRDDLLKNAKDKYSHSVSEESFGSTIYFYCSTCSYIVGYRDREQLKQLNLEYESASSAYYLSCGDDDIGVEFDNQEDDFFNIDYLNPAYEWVKSNRPCSAPPKIHC
ncbi:unnamed protein product [Trichobilharzia regenti]|nr:unnamed protein product [Trichobilharzia regenti]